MSLSQAFLLALAFILASLFIAGIAAARGNAAALGFVRRFVVAEPNEISAMLLSAVYFFCTMTAYSILRPVRDEIAVASGVRDLPKLFLATLATMLVVTPIYGALVARVPVRKFVRIVYQFIALNLVGFFFAWKMQVSPIAMQWVFFAWTTVLGVFGPSLFWSVMADTYSNAQAKRIFGFIGVGGTIGFISGLAITGFLTDTVGTHNLMLVSAVFILLAATLAGMVPNAAAGSDTIASERKQTAVLGGSAFAGAIHVLKSPYLAMIALFLFLYLFASAIMYSAQTVIVGDAITDRATRTEFLARIGLATQIAAAMGQIFLTARLMKLGLQWTLPTVSVVSIIGFAALGMTAFGWLPVLGTFVAFQVARSASEYMLTQPSRKVLFTVLSREDKYKTTNFLETFVYRAGDQLAIYIFAGLSVSAGLALTTISWLAVPVMCMSLGVSLWLARRQKELAAQPEAQESARV